jgi:small conductance mechanosensitive channel
VTQIAGRFDQLGDLLTSYAWWGYVLRTILYFFVAWIVQRLAWRLSGPIVGLVTIAPQGRHRQERQKTLRSLIASAVRFLAFGAAVLLTASQFVQTDTLVWMVGLFSAAFGLGARPLIGDVLSGISFIFEDTFAVGEKVEMMNVEGVVEAVNLRTTWLRAPTGELYVMPNGEVRLVRNFSRGRFSSVQIKLKVAAADLNRALPLLEELGTEAVRLLPNLLEPWQVISESGVIGRHTELTLLAKARFGKAAEMRPRMLTLIQERLADAEISLND